ncbi:hypothetical protein DL93DRAFT_2097144 [Clavulina sp. PMI_390]|nr:hypothetical protein DL93DRAFT_2097144 [Clavulina sp. PMI_390]
MSSHWAPQGIGGPSPPSGSRSSYQAAPPSNASPAARIPYYQRKLPQVPQSSSPGPHSRASSVRDRKPMGARSYQPTQEEQLAEAMALKKAEKFLASAPTWSNPSTADHSSMTHTAPKADRPVEIAPQSRIPASAPHPSAAPAIIQGQNPVPAPAPQPQYQQQQQQQQQQHFVTMSNPVVGLPPVAESAEFEEEDRHAALFGDNACWRNSTEDDEVPPPFSAIASIPMDPQLEQTMAQLQQMNFSGSSAQLQGEASARSSAEYVPSVTMVATPNPPAPLNLVPETATSGQQYEQPHVSSAPATTTTYNMSSQADAGSQHEEPASTSNRYSAPAASNASRATLGPAQFVRMRFDSSVAYKQDARLNLGPEDEGMGLRNASPNAFYAASVSSTMKVGPRRPPARNRDSVASFMSSNSIASTASAPTTYSSMGGFAASSDMYQSSSYPSTSSSNGPLSPVSWGQDQQYASPQDDRESMASMPMSPGASMRSRSPPPRSSSPLSVRSGRATASSIHNSLHDELGAGAAVGGQYDPRQGAALYEQAKLMEQQPQPAGYRASYVPPPQQPAGVPAPTPGGYYPPNQNYPARAPYPPQRQGTLVSQQPAQPVSHPPAPARGQPQMQAQPQWTPGAPQPPWAQGQPSIEQLRAQTQQQPIYQRPAGNQPPAGFVAPGPPPPLARMPPPRQQAPAAPVPGSYMYAQQAPPQQHQQQYQQQYQPPYGQNRQSRMF